MHIERIGETNHRVGGRFRKMSPRRVASQCMRVKIFAFNFRENAHRNQNIEKEKNQSSHWRMVSMGPHGGQDLRARFHDSLSYSG